MVDIFSRKAPFEEVITSQDAIEYHVRRFERGNRDNLARQCYQHFMMERDRLARLENANPRD